jgi:hypothetical protein
MKGGQRRPTRNQDPSIGAEVEAFLAGEYLDYLDSLNRAVPAWAWLNPLAHGSLEKVRALAVYGRDRRLAPEPRRRWHELVADVAERVLSIVDQGGRPLEAVQRALLVPLELRLAARPMGGHLSPEAIAREVTSLLDHPLAAC